VLRPYKAAAADRHRDFVVARRWEAGRRIDTVSTLAPWAMHANQSRGRRFPETPHKYRSEYARDRDRIVHARAFRRLEAKTQVFTMRFSDHFRNRLTHTL
jgi:dGTP triphosphohydrolase